MSHEISKDQWLHLLTTSLKAAAHGVVITNERGEIIWVNPAFTTMTGYEESEVLGKNPSILNSGVQDESFYQKLWATLLVGDTWRGEIVNRRKDGSLYAERQSIQPVYWNSAEITHFIAIKEDISEQKKIQASIGNLNRVTLIGSLASGISNKINNPLAYVRSNLAVLRQQLVDEDGKAVLSNLSPSESCEIIDDAIEGTRRIETVVTDLRKLSKYDDHFMLRPTDLEGAIEAALQMVGIQFEDCVELIRDFASTPKKVMAEQARLVHALANLLTNARQAIPLESTEKNYILLTTRYRDTEAIVEITDTGVGIAETTMAHIFEPFYSTKPTADGLGMGLPISQKIITSLGGRLEVESPEESGTICRITLAMYHEESQSVVPGPA